MYFHWKGWIGTILVILLSRNSGGQDLAQLAAHEKQRRQKGAAVRIHIEQGPSERDSADNHRSSAVSEKGNPGKDIGVVSTVSSKPRSADLLRRAYLLRRGPQVKEKIRTEQRRLEEMERELQGATHDNPPLWRQGRWIENSKVVTSRRSVERSRKNLEQWKGELHLMEEEVRLRNWPPGILRGQLP